MRDKHAMQTEFKWGVLLGEGKREEREKGSTQKPHGKREGKRERERVRGGLQRVRELERETFRERKRAKESEREEEEEEKGVDRFPPFKEMEHSTCAQKPLRGDSLC